MSAAVQKSAGYTSRLRPAWKPGQSGNPAGKPKGTLSKFNRDIKEMILTALNNVGGADYLAEQARKNPNAFLALVGKVLPMQLANTDADGKPVLLHLVAARVVSDELHVHIQQQPRTIEHEPMPQGDLLDAPLPSE